MVAGMGPRQIQSSLNNDFCEQKDIFMKKKDHISVLALDARKGKNWY